MIIKSINFEQNGSNYVAYIQPTKDFSIHLASDTAGIFTIMRSIAPNISEDNEGYYSVFSNATVSKVLDTAVTNWLPGTFCKIISTVPLTSSYYG